MGNMNIGGPYGRSGMNPAGMMTGMMMGGAMGQQMASMMNNMGQNMQNVMNQPPQMPNSQYFIVQNKQQIGLFNMQQLQQLALSGQLSQQTYVWKQGMAKWEYAGNVQELMSLFTPPQPDTTQTPPPMPDK
jgi:hypothetical protein